LDRGYRQQGARIRDGNAKADAKVKIDKRMSELRASHERRSAKLKGAWKSPKEAFAA